MKHVGNIVIKTARVTGLVTSLALGANALASPDHATDLFSKGPLTITNTGCDQGDCCRIVFDFTQTSSWGIWADRAAATLIDYYPDVSSMLDLPDLTQGSSEQTAESVLSVRIGNVFRIARQAKAREVVLNLPDWDYTLTNEEYPNQDTDASASSPYRNGPLRVSPVRCGHGKCYLITFDLSSPSSWKHWADEAAEALMSYGQLQNIALTLAGDGAKRISKFTLSAKIGRIFREARDKRVRKVVVSVPDWEYSFTGQLPATEVVDLFNRGPLVITPIACEQGSCCQVVFDFSKSSSWKQWADIAAETLTDYYPTQSYALDIAEFLAPKARVSSKFPLSAKIGFIFGEAIDAATRKVVIDFPSWEYSFVGQLSADHVIDIYNSGPLTISPVSCNQGICCQILFDLSQSSSWKYWADKAAEELVDYYPIRSYALDYADILLPGAREMGINILSMKVMSILYEAQLAKASRVSIMFPQWKYSF